MEESETHKNIEQHHEHSRTPHGKHKGIIIPDFIPVAGCADDMADRVVFQLRPY